MKDFVADLPLCQCGKPIAEVRASYLEGVLLFALSTVGETITSYYGSCGNGCLPVELSLVQAKQARQTGVIIFKEMT